MRPGAPHDVISLQGRNAMTRAEESFRPLAIRQDVESSGPFELRRLWQELRSGAWQFVDTFSTEQRYIALLRASVVVPPVPLHERKALVLESVLLGTPPKVVALDSQRSLSS